MTSESRIIAALSTNTGRAIVNLLQKRGDNLTDVFVTDERYKSRGSGFQTFDDLFNSNSKTKLHKIKRLTDHIDTIKEAKPDFMLMNFSEILTPEILEIPRYGAAGFHYAPLPERRGANPVMWSIIHGLDKSCVTLHYYDENIDKGDIIDVEPFPIERTDDSKQVLQKVEVSIVKLLENNLDNMKNGTASRRKQEGQGIYTPRRTYGDGRIYFSKMPAEQIYNTVRALRPPYAGAYARCGPKGESEKLYLMWCDVVDQQKVNLSKIIDWKKTRQEIHDLISISSEGEYAATGNGYLRITETRIGELKE
jgi:methionyl-tRNA formyltransferase